MVFPSFKKSLVIFCAGFAIVILFAAIPALFHHSRDVISGKAVKFDDSMILVSHAGAGLPQSIYSNSREALEMAASRGMDYVEMDFSLTSDMKVVASHDWGVIYAALHQKVARPAGAWAKTSMPEIPSYSQFMNTPMRGNLHAVDLAYLSDWLKHHPGVRLVTDAKFSNLSFLHDLTKFKGFPLAQVIPQIYSRAEFKPVKEMGFRNIIYTLYREGDISDGDVIAFAQKNNVKVTMPIYRAKREVLEAYRAAGITVYVHTINNPEVARQLESWGANGIYTDFLYH